MRRPTALIVSGLLLLVAVPAPAARAQVHEPKGAALTDEQGQALGALLGGLALRPFGTGASLSVSVRGAVATIVTGTLHDAGPAVTARTRFNVASVSKLLTAAKVIALAHDGRVGLDDPLARHLPGVRCQDATGRDRTGEVTLRGLLKHRAGLPHEPGDLDPRPRGNDWTDPALLRALTEDWTITLRGEPGDYAYSNVGYALLGAVVERAAGASFAGAMDGFLRGLDLGDSTFWPPDDDLDFAHGRVDLEGETGFRAPTWYHSRYALPFTGLWATTPDLARFGQALLAATADPAHPLHAMTRLDAQAGHGLGPVVRQRRGARSLEHDGSGPGFLAWLVVIPEREVVLALACNGGGESRAQGRRLAEVVEAMLAALLGAPRGR